jgi:hypothetical protein
LKVSNKFAGCKGSGFSVSIINNHQPLKWSN